MGLFSGRAKREEHEQEAEQVRWLSKLAREDLLELGERLEDEAPPAEEAALAERAEARRLTAEARPRLREAETSDAIIELQKTIYQAFVHLARSDAIVRGDEPPTASEPCAFNPQHGPAVAQAIWAPIGGDETTYSCCQPDADLIREGKAPRRRTIKLDTVEVAWDELGNERRMPRDLRSKDAAFDYEMLNVTIQRSARGMGNMGGGIRP